MIDDTVFMVVVWFMYFAGLVKHFSQTNGNLNLHFTLPLIAYVQRPQNHEEK